MGREGYRLIRMLILIKFLQGEDLLDPSKTAPLGIAALITVRLEGNYHNTIHLTESPRKYNIYQRSKYTLYIRRTDFSSVMCSP